MTTTRTSDIAAAAAADHVQWSPPGRLTLSALDSLAFGEVRRLKRLMIGVEQRLVTTKNSPRSGVSVHEMINCRSDASGQNRRAR